MNAFVTVAVSLAGMLVGATPAAAPATSDPGLVVSVSWLSQHQHDRNLVILAFGRQGEYEKAHVPGALSVAPESLENMSGKSMDMTTLPSESALHATLEKLGISDGSQVVLVLTGNSVPTVTRAQYIMLYAGLDHVAILDGGLDAWKGAGNPVSAAIPPAPARGHITGHVRPAMIVDAAFVQAHQGAAHSRIVDARTPAYFSGAGTTDMSGMHMAAGHVPGAVNLPFNSLLDDSLHLLPVAALEQKFRAAGIAPGDTIIGYCHVGMQATTMLLGARLTGHPVKLYTGSFHDWSDKKLPTEGGKP